MKNKVIILIIFTILVTSIGGAMLYRPSIHDCTYESLLEIDDIGEVLAERIVLYLENNPGASVNDLVVIHGIGEERLKLIKERYR